ncbi:MAG TPA: hemolysin III family protein [Longimicrobiales bacterium]|nr:hemolysin III family protein [Longimicrobiales bacterium]
MEREELANAVTHALGVALSLAGGSVLIVLAALAGEAAMIVGVSVFVASSVLLYTASASFHAARSGLWKRRLKVLDHAAIYVLIAGTYTPFTLALRGGWGWSLFGVIWGLAAAGVVFKLFFTGRFPAISTAIYVAMGWLALIAVAPLVRQLELPTLAWLLAGGLAYTGGTAFYHWERLRYAHAVWHAFVLAGTLCHGIAVGLQI